MTSHINEGAIKIIELIGVSQESFEDAIQNGVRKAASSVQDIKGVEVIKMTGKVKSDKITEYHANMKVAFVVR